MNIGSYIDHTLLKADARKEDIEKLCREAIDYNFKAVCINPYFLPYARQLLEGSQVKLATVIGFPLGNTSSGAKLAEARRALEDGADELDMVINISALKDEDYDIVYKDIKAIRDISQGKTLKVIIETGLLTEEEILKASDLVLKSKADYVKTSTGFNARGASIKDINLIKSKVRDKIKIKASGGIRDYPSFKEMIGAGAHRIGTSSALNILDESRRY